MIWFVQVIKLLCIEKKSTKIKLLNRIMVQLGNIHKRSSEKTITDQF